MEKKELNLEQTEKVTGGIEKRKYAADPMLDGPEGKKVEEIVYVIKVPDPVPDPVPVPVPVPNPNPEKSSRLT